jgi:LPXTG-motif cell wall-anchored protein
MRRAGIVIMVMAALGLSLAVPASAQDYGAEPGITCPDVVQAGGTLTLSGTNWLPESTVVLTIDGEVVGTPETDSTGSFTTTVTIPADLEPGQHSLVATGRDQNGDPFSANCPFTVTGAEAPGIPVTGTNVSLGLIILGAMIAVGIGFLVASRRKKAEASH